MARTTRPILRCAIILAALAGIAAQGQQKNTKTAVRDQLFCMNKPGAYSRKTPTQGVDCYCAQGSPTVNSLWCRAKKYPNVVKGVAAGVAALGGLGGGAAVYLKNKATPTLPALGSSNTPSPTTTAASGNQGTSTSGNQGGQTSAAPTTAATTTKKNSSSKLLWLWILLGILGLCCCLALCAALASMLGGKKKKTKTRKTRVSQPAPVPAPVVVEEQQELLPAVPPLLEPYPMMATQMMPAMPMTAMPMAAMPMSGATQMMPGATPHLF